MSWQQPQIFCSNQESCVASAEKASSCCKFCYTESMLRQFFGYGISVFCMDNCINQFHKITCTFLLLKIWTNRSIPRYWKSSQTFLTVSSCMLLWLLPAHYSQVLVHSTVVNSRLSHKYKGYDKEQVSFQSSCIAEVLRV